MLSAFILSWWGWFMLGLRLVAALGDAGPAAVPRRLIVFVVGWPLFGLLNLCHWFGFLVDEVLFPGYRHVQVDKPLFIVGVPRSGTTHLHRVLSRDDQFSSLTMLECVLAPSIAERHLWFGLARLLGRVEWRWSSPLLSRMDQIHEIRLDEPEEDFLLLLFVGACFLGIVVCPRNEHYWNLARFDRMPKRFRRSVTTFYRRCVQKHLYYHGQHRRLLSKNPSFTPFIESLRDEFEDAKFIACVRHPRETLPSQLSSLLPALELLGHGRLPEGFQHRMIGVLSDYYRLIGRGTFPVVEMGELEQLEVLVRRLYLQLDTEVSAEFARVLAQLDGEARRYQSGHRYRLEQFGLSESLVDDLFEEVWPIGPANKASGVA